MRREGRPYELRVVVGRVAGKAVPMRLPRMHEGTAPAAEATVKGGRAVVHASAMAPVPLHAPSPSHTIAPSSPLHGAVVTMVRVGVGMVGAPVHTGGAAAVVLGMASGVVAVVAGVRAPPARTARTVHEVRRAVHGVGPTPIGPHAVPIEGVRIPVTPPPAVVGVVAVLHPHRLALVVRPSWRRAAAMPMARGRLPRTPHRLGLHLRALV